MKEDTTNASIVIIALVATLALLGVVAVTIVTITQEAEARGCNRSVPFNASQGRCFRP